MAEISVSTKAADIIADIKATISEITVGGSSVFVECEIYDDLQSFTGVANPLKGTAAGIIAGNPVRGTGSSNLEKYTERLDIQIAVRFMLKRKAGADEVTAVQEMNRLAAIVRKALMIDPSRGGRANMIAWSGGVLNGTDVSGDARLQTNIRNQSFFVATIPVTVGWYEPAA